MSPIAITDSPFPGGSLGRPGLLVSVRSPAEAKVALEGGAALIDVKEPGQGPLGRADTATIAHVVEAVAGRAPVSAALGELREQASLPHDLQRRLAFLKWGLAGWHKREDWRQELARLASNSPSQVVVVGYADWPLADAPPLEKVGNFACQRPGNVLLVDTFAKDQGRSLLDWLSLEEIEVLGQKCRHNGVRLALAGSLGPVEIRTLLPVGPDWFAVRGAACERSLRQARVCINRVRDLVGLLARGVS